MVVSHIGVVRRQGDSMTGLISVWCGLRVLAVVDPGIRHNRSLSETEGEGGSEQMAVKATPTLEKMHDIKMEMIALDLRRARVKDKEKIVSLINRAGEVHAEFEGVIPNADYSYVATSQMTMKDLKSLFNSVRNSIELDFQIATQGRAVRTMVVSDNEWRPEQNLLNSCPW